MKRVMSLIRPVSLLLVGLGAGIIMMMVAQDVQRLERLRHAQEARMSVQAERIMVLEAELAYLSRPETLRRTLTSADPSAVWVHVRGENVQSFAALVGHDAGATATRLAATDGPANIQ